MEIEPIDALKPAPPIAIIPETLNSATGSNIMPQLAVEYTSAQQGISTDDGVADMKALKIKQSRRIRVKQARPRIVFLAACLTYLITSLTFIRIGLLHISNKVESRLEMAQSELQAVTSGERRENMLCTQLGNLLAEQLSARFMETHEECLVRGLKEANDQLFDVGFQYSRIRDESMNWATENCDRLLYTPHVFAFTTQQAIRRTWAHMSYRISKCANKVLGFMNRKAHSAWNRLFEVDTVWTRPAQIDHVSSSKRSQDRYDMLSSVPQGFHLKFKTDQRCHLEYTSVTDERSDTSLPSADAVTKLKQKVTSSLSWESKLIGFKSCFERSTYILMFSQVFLALADCIANSYVLLLDTGTARVGAHMVGMRLQDQIPKEAVQFFFWLLLEFAAVACIEVQVGTRQTMSIVITWGIFFSAWGISTLLRSPSSTSLSRRECGLLQLVKELCLIIHGHELQDLGSENKNSDAHDENQTKTTGLATHLERSTILTNPSHLETLVAITRKHGIRLI